MCYLLLFSLSLVSLVFLSREKCNLFAFLSNSDLPVFYFNIFPHFFGDLLSFLKLKMRAAHSSCPFQNSFCFEIFPELNPLHLFPLPQSRWHSQHLIWCSILMVHSWSLFPSIYSALCCETYHPELSLITSLTSLRSRLFPYCPKTLCW